jgi:endonuclease V-like protein UPF0215 family
MISQVKDGIHVVAIDDAPHHRGNSSTQLFFLYCKSTFIEKITHTTVSVDGTDSTIKILEELESNHDQFTLILLHGVTVGGLNIVDIQEISNSLKKPLLAVTENPPSQNSIYSAIEHLEDSALRKKLLEKAGPLFQFPSKHGSIPIYYHANGISEKIAKEFFTKFCIRSRLPEQLLLAHKIASAWR